jgi:hypothetical protein
VRVSGGHSSFNIISRQPRIKSLDTSSRIDEVILGNSGKVRATVAYNDARTSFQLPSRVIVKGGYNRFGPDMEFIYFNEMHFYRDILPLLNINAPLCLYADRDEQNQQSLIILEDLSLRDVKWCHATRFGAKGAARCAA